jgi:hypothetical protein
MGGASTVTEGWGFLGGTLVVGRVFLLQEANATAASSKMPRTLFMP